MIKNHQFFTFLSIVAVWMPFSVLEQGTKPVKPKVTEATFFKNGAAVTEQFKVNLDRGKNILLIESLPEDLDVGSLQIKSSLPVSIISSVFSINYQKKASKTPEMLGLEEIKANLEDQIDLQLDMQKAMEARLEILKANQQLSAGLARVEELRNLMEFQQEQTLQILSEQRKAEKVIEDLEQERAKILIQLSDLENVQENAKGQITLILEAENEGYADIEFNYLTTMAYWSPQYDLKAPDLNSPLELSLFANYRQYTGKSWKQVQISFSTQDPFIYTTTPNLYPWNLDFMDYQNDPSNSIFRLQNLARDRRLSGLVIDGQGNPLPFVSVQIPGTSIGAQTNQSGRFSIMIPSETPMLRFSLIGYRFRNYPLNRNEDNIKVVLSNEVIELYEETPGRYSSNLIDLGFQETFDEMLVDVPESRIEEKQTNFTITIEQPMDISSSLETDRIELLREEVEASYQYYLVPKESSEAHLTAKVPNLGILGIPEGSAKLYFEESYVGVTYLDQNSLADTLQLSLGTDEQVLIKRERTKKDSRTQFLGGNTIASREYTLSVRNNKSRSIPFILQDQIPVSRNQEIVVTTQEISNGKLNSDTGILSWEGQLQPNTLNEWKIRFEVRYPSKRKVIID